MKNKKTILGIIIFLFAITGICSISHAFVDEFKISPMTYGGYDLGYLTDGDIIKINEIDSSGSINVYIMNDEQYDEVKDSGGLIWNYFIRWKDITYLSGLTFDITIDDDYYIIFYNKNLLFSRTVKVNIFVEYKSITITSPTSTSTFENGYNIITWSSTGNIDYVIIDLYKNGYFLETIRSGISNDGEYSWYIYADEYTDSSYYQIKIRDYYDSTTYDYSSYFTIQTETKTITITSPTSSSTFLSGYNSITWTNTGDISYVKIELYKSGIFLETIDSYEYNDGSYSWYIYDDEYVDSSYYQIKILDYYDNTIYDYSGSFTIECETESDPIPTPIPDPDPVNTVNRIINIILMIAVISVIISAIVIPIVIHKRKKRGSEEVITPIE